jgi:Fic family protein
MAWNWQLLNWPNFHYSNHQLLKQENEFLFKMGQTCAFLTQLSKIDYQQFLVEILSSEGVESAKIEGELLDRESLQSSIRQHFGLTKHGTRQPKERNMAELLCSVYESFHEPLSHEMIHQWHARLFHGQDVSFFDQLGSYRSHEEPMQIVSTKYGHSKVFFEAPPSARLYREMSQFIDWFNASHQTMPILGRAAIAHVYFESIHPFEDGNGRIGRLLVEKILSQGIGKPTLISVSKILEKRKKEYYACLEKCNHTLEVTAWATFFADSILQAQTESKQLLFFLLEKSKLFTRLQGQLNLRQEKALLRMFAEGPEGFKGGLTAEKYIAITKTSKATATRDLGDLVEKKALYKTGELRYTRYWLNLG